MRCVTGSPHNSNDTVLLVVDDDVLLYRFEDLREPLVKQISEIRAKMLYSPHKETAV